MKLTKSELETIVRLDQTNDPATVYTYEKRLIKIFTKGIEDGLVESDTEDGMGGHTFVVPKKNMRIRLKRKGTPKNPALSPVFRKKEGE